MRIFRKNEKTHFQVQHECQQVLKTAGSAAVAGGVAGVGECHQHFYNRIEKCSHLKFRPNIV